MNSNSVLLIVIALLFGYLAISGKYNCLANFWKCSQGDNCNCGSKESADPYYGLTSYLPALPNIANFV